MFRTACNGGDDCRLRVPLGREDRVNDMNDAIVCEDVGVDDPSAVHTHVACIHRDVKGLALQCGQGHSILQVGCREVSRDDVIPQGVAHVGEGQQIEEVQIHQRSDL